MNAAPVSVPQASPGAACLAHKAAIDAAVARVLESGWYILGREGEAFEAEFAQWLGTARAVGCANGTDALALILRGLGIGPGDAVATVSHTAVATVAAIEMVGARAVLIDIDPVTFTMCPRDFAAALPRHLDLRAVIPVHLYGQAADLDAIIPPARARGLSVIEDCSQAHGASLGGRKLGTIGDAAAFSLYPTKPLAALGDGGVLATNAVELADRIAALRQYGWRERYVSDLVGVNSRLDELQAAILRARLPLLDAENARRGTIAAAYDLALSGTRFAPPARRANATHVFHQYVVRARDREASQAALRAQGIGTAVHYPVPVHLQPAYRGRIATGPAGCRETERAAREVLSLPMFPQLTNAQVETVCAALRSI
ncbi:MAG: DegT/DnrJ/EryC1/StrS family aminotransferase [Acetobacteraceae bacterium]|nr:DegT/DnrJ/EryC1/StrS family aminotransferase [Acetobacteraceae bacterium]